MKRIIISMAVMAALALAVVPASRAVDVDFLVSANIPAANGVSIVASKVDSASNQFFAGTVDALNFDPMIFNSELGIWLPNHYFAIDVGVTNGAGTVDVTVDYDEGTPPAGQTKGLGWKSTATFVKITGPDDNQVETELANNGPKQLLINLAGGEDVDPDDVAGGFLRIYVGIFPGDDQTILNQGGEPFTNADVPGLYDGTLTISATAV